MQSIHAYCDEGTKQYTYDDIINRMVKGRGGALTPDAAKTLISRHMSRNDDTNLYQFTYDKLLHIYEKLHLFHLVLDSLFLLLFLSFS